MKFYITVALFIVLTSTVATLRMHGDPYPGVGGSIFRPKPLQKPESRIVGGEIAPLAYAPWQVSLQNKFGNHFCGGAIIAEQHVITAASCVAGLQARNIKVVTSTNNLTADAFVYDVAAITIHCNYDRPLYHNDIALIRLATPIAYDERTQNITIAELDDLTIGETLTMTGWGSWQLSEQYQEDLKKLNATLVSNEECKSIYGKYSDDVDDGHLCVRTPRGTGACHGDTGGPLVNSEGILVGIGNWGVPCAEGFPDVFARISFYNDWIRTNIRGCSMAP